MGDRENVHRWARNATVGPANSYHPFTPRGLYAQSYQRERFIRMIVENEIPLDQMEILDLGCGAGTWCRYFSELKGTTDGIVGVDLSAERLKLARSLSPIEYIEGDITRLPEFLDRNFDFVSAFVSLMFLRDSSELRTVLADVYDALRPGGYFFVYERDERHELARDASGWPRTELSEEIRAAGFDVVAEHPLFKVLLGMKNPLEGTSFGSMEWARLAERLLPGSWAFYAILARSAEAEHGNFGIVTDAEAHSRTARRK
jgi:SAM-dependent methyltransferase